MNYLIVRIIYNKKIVSMWIIAIATILGVNCIGSLQGVIHV